MGALAIAAALLVSRAAAAPSHPLSQSIRETWTYRNGLPHNLVHRVLVSRTGYLWLGTQEGLVRFDGARFRSWDHADTPGLTGNEITALLEDEAGVLWVGTSHGLSRVEHDQVEAVDLGGDRNVTALAADGAGGLWIGTEGEGLRHLVAGKLVPAPDVGPRVVTLAPGRDGALWIGTHGGVLRWAGGRVEQAAGAGLPGAAVYQIQEDRRGAVWFGTANGLYVRRPGAPAAVRGPVPEETGIRALLEDREGNVWAGSDVALHRIPADGRAPPEAVPSLDPHTLAEDAEGSIWVGTETRGLHRIRWGQLVSYGRSEGLGADVVWTVLQARDGAMLLAGDGGLDRLEGDRVTPLHAGVLGRRALTALLEDRAGDLWVGLADHGLVRFGRDGRAARLGAPEGLPDSMPRALVEDGGGALWLGTGAGLFRRDGQGRFHRTPLGPGLRGGYVNALAEAADGTIWVGTTTELGQVQDGRIVPAEADGAPVRADVTFLRTEPDGAVWIGTVGDGLLRYRAGRLDRWTRRQGLHEDSVLGILDDGRGSLWLSGNRGISRIRREELDGVAAGRLPAVAPAVFGIGDGMRERECNGGVQPSAWRARDGRLWFATIGGAVVVDPATVQVNPTAPPVRIEQVIVDGRPVPPGGPLRLGAGVRRVEVHYTGLALAAADRIRFRHRLDGLDDAFVEAGTDRVAHYTGLAPGRYTFRVVAANEAGRWGTDEARIAFELEPSLWERPAFRGLLAAAAAGGLVAFVSLRTRALRRRQRELAARVEEEMRKVKVLSGLLPICSWCKKIKDEQGSWHRVEDYVTRRTEAQFTHGMCPSCFAAHGGDGHGGEGHEGGGSPPPSSAAG